MPNRIGLILFFAPPANGQDVEVLINHFLFTPWIPGDANRDGRVDETDAAILADHWGQVGMNWTTGDFDRDGTVGPADAAILVANWGYGTSDSNPVAEPSALILVGLGATSLLFQIRRRKQVP